MTYFTLHNNEVYLVKEFNLSCFLLVSPSSLQGTVPPLGFAIIGKHMHIVSFLMQTTELDKSLRGVNKFGKNCSVPAVVPFSNPVVWTPIWLPFHIGCILSLIRLHDYLWNVCMVIQLCLLSMGVYYPNSNHSSCMPAIAITCIP